MSKNVYRRKDGRYEGRIFLGKDENGRKIYRSFYGKTESEVALKLADINNSDNVLTELTVKDVIFEYLTYVKPQIKESTWANYRMKAEKHLIPVFESVKCRSITAEKVYDFINMKKQQNLSARYIADILVLFKAIFRYASKVHHFRDPLAVFKIPKAPKSDVAVLSKNEQEQLLRYISGDFSYLGIIIALYTGMRIGEICALKWSDVDFNKKTIFVRRTLQRIQSSDKKTKIVITEPKSVSSIREIPIPECLLSLLSKYRCEDSIFVLSGNYRPVECRTLQYRFVKALNNAKLPSVHFHSLRHAFATNCIALGFDIKTLSEILGHSRIEITMNRYVHSSMDRKRAFMSLLKWVA